mmetsp:Transcript_39812/g.44484  ORF Transcript_39812/g.44484 Transcript_39812/m.44484 type:complete len:98 (+) Transcript_39812:61-354(+)
MSSIIFVSIVDDADTNTSAAAAAATADTCCFDRSRKDRTTADTETYRIIQQMKVFIIIMEVHIPMCYYYCRRGDQSKSARYVLFSLLKNTFYKKGNE